MLLTFKVWLERKPTPPPFMADAMVATSGMYEEFHRAAIEECRDGSVVYACSREVSDPPGKLPKYQLGWMAGYAFVPMGVFYHKTTAQSPADIIREHTGTL